MGGLYYGVLFGMHQVTYRKVGYQESTIDGDL